MKKLLLSLMLVLFFASCGGMDGFDINGDGEPDGTHFPPEDWDKFIDATKSKVVYKDNGVETSTPFTLLAGSDMGYQSAFIGAARGIITDVNQYVRFEITIKFVGKYAIYFSNGDVSPIYGDSNGSATEVITVDVNDGGYYSIDDSVFFIEYYASEDEVDNESTSIHYQNVQL